MHKVDNSKFTKFMRHRDSIFSGSKDDLLSSRQACYSQHYSHPVVKAISSSSPGGLSSSGSFFLPAGGGRQSYLNNSSQGQVSDCLCWGVSVFPPFFPLSSLRMGSQMCLSCWRRWGGAVGRCLKIAKGYGVSVGS